jgi:uncharacterized protein YgiM (DUF1202 family)
VFFIRTKTNELEVNRFVKANRSLNIRDGAGASYKLNGAVAACEKLHVVAEAKGTMGSVPLWGKLCDGRGWIPLESGYTTDL